ncbi:hypothetical protein CKH23_17540 [Salmonella enterica]|nr:hypothetical protein [Salmonella enterica]EBK3282589.1 hypothetical protein [Salmonella enterica]
MRILISFAAVIGLLCISAGESFSSQKNNEEIMTENKTEREKTYVRAIEISRMLVSGHASLADVKRGGFFDDISKFTPKLREETEYITLSKNKLLAVGINRKYDEVSNDGWFSANLVLTTGRDSLMFRFSDCSFIKQLELEFISFEKIKFSYGPENKYEDIYYSYLYAWNKNKNITFEFKAPELFHENKECSKIFSSVEIKNLSRTEKHF